MSYETCANRFSRVMAGGVNRAERCQTCKSTTNSSAAKPATTPDKTLLRSAQSATPLPTVRSRKNETNASEAFAQVGYDQSNFLGSLLVNSAFGRALRAQREIPISVLMTGFRTAEFAMRPRSPTLLPTTQRSEQRTFWMRCLFCVSSSVVLEKAFPTRSTTCLRARPFQSHLTETSE